MKKILQQGLVWIAFLMLCSPVGAYSKIDSAGLMQIEMDIWGDNGNEYASVIGKNEAGETVWSYYAEGHGMTENSAYYSLGVRDDLYYFDDNGTLIAFQVETGDIVWKNEDAPHVISSYLFDEKGRIICVSSCGPDLCLISPEGETEVVIKNINQDYYWAVKVDNLGADMIRVWFAANYLDLPYREEGYSLEINLADYLESEKAEEAVSSETEKSSQTDDMEIKAYRTCLGDYEWISELETRYQLTFRKYAFADLNNDGSAELILKEYNEQNEPQYGSGSSVIFTYKAKSGKVKQVSVLDPDDDSNPEEQDLLGGYYGPSYCPKINGLEYSSGDRHGRYYYRYAKGHIFPYKYVGVYRDSDRIGWTVTDAATKEEQFMTDAEYNSLTGEIQELTWYDVRGNLTAQFEDYYREIEKSETKETPSPVAVESESKDALETGITIEDFLGDYATEKGGGIEFFMNGNQLGVSTFLIFTDGVHQAGGTHAMNTWYADSYELNRDVLTLHGGSASSGTTYVLNEDGTLQMNASDGSSLYYPWKWETPISIEKKNPGDGMLVQNCNEFITLRKSPSADGEEVARIPLGKEVSFLSWGKNGFYKVDYEGQIGYALADFLVLLR